MAHDVSTYKVQFDNLETKLCYFPLGFAINRLNIYQELIIEGGPPLKYGDVGYHDLSVHVRGLQKVKLDTRNSPMHTLMYDRTDFKMKMQPIYVVNMRFVEGRKICFREFTDYFFGISHKIDTNGEDVEIEIEEFLMNSYHELHTAQLDPSTTSIPLTDYILTDMREAMVSDSFIDQMFAIHLFYSRFAQLITKALLQNRGESDSIRFEMDGVLPTHFQKLVRAIAATVIDSAMEIDRPEYLSRNEVTRSQIIPWTNGWRQDGYTANRLRLTVSNIEKLQSIFGRYFAQIMLTTGSDREQGVSPNMFYAIIPFDEPGIVIDYDINSFELIFKAKVAKVNKATVFRDQKEYWNNQLVASKENLVGHWFYCCKRKANVKVVLVEKNINSLYTKSKTEKLKPIRCLIAWAVAEFAILAARSRRQNEDSFIACVIEGRAYESDENKKILFYYDARNDFDTDVGIIPYGKISTVQAPSYGDLKEIATVSATRLASKLIEREEKLHFKDKGFSSQLVIGWETVNRKRRLDSRIGDVKTRSDIFEKVRYFLTGCSKGEKQDKNGIITLQWKDEYNIGDMHYILSALDSASENALGDIHNLLMCAVNSCKSPLRFLETIHTCFQNSDYKFVDDDETVDAFQERLYNKGRYKNEIFGLNFAKYFLDKIQNVKPSSASLPPQQPITTSSLP